MDETIKASDLKRLMDVVQAAVVLVNAMMNNTMVTGREDPEFDALCVALEALGLTEVPNV